MPAKSILLDQRAKTLHDFGTAFCNFVSFNPQGRLIALAGFGNLAGKVDIYDRRTLNKVTTLDASNTSHCEWSPDGRFLLTATLSPRLRVDNGIKVWHCSGPLVHVQNIDELYQASWRPAHVDACPPFPAAVPPAPAPSPSVTEHLAVAGATPSKPAGTYRPPGARGLVASSVYKRGEDTPSPSATANGRYSRSPAPGRVRAGRRHVPGAPTSPSPVRNGGEQQDKRGRKRKGPKEPKKEGGEDQLQVPPSLEIPTNGNGTQTPANGSVPPTPSIDASVLDPTAKKIRNLNKKVGCLSSIFISRSPVSSFQLKAIEELKEKQKKGERLEATQLKKIETEADIRKELDGLDIS